MNKPLADRVRPKCFEDVVGQEHLLGKGKILSRMLSSDIITNMIFYGPPGVGKTTVANIIADKTKKKLYKLNATNAGIKDIHNIIKNLDTLFTISGVLLYLDEIQNFNKKQQQSLLEFIEKGQITLIASTAENPYHFVYKSILSRSTVFEFKLLNRSHIIKALKRVIDMVEKELTDTQIECDDRALEYIADVSGGDLRKAVNALEIAVYSTKKNVNNKIHIDLDIACDSCQAKIMGYDKMGDNHYDILSAFQKSIRGSDPDAALHYLARLIKAGDLISICRRLMVIASEDIGMAYPNAVCIIKNCVDGAMQLGFPEARIPLAQAVLVLSTAPKSNSVICAIDNALKEIEAKDTGDIPLHLKDSHYSGAEKLGRGQNYLYPHNYKNNFVKQQYLPDNIKESVYYLPGNNKMENKIQQFLNELKEDK